jgi:oligopeptide/dipeptide ABC transporter ATP-binding protein
VAHVSDVRQVFAPPYHPYTEALLAAAPRPDPDAGPPKIVLSGSMASATQELQGCPFASRCPHRRAVRDAGAAGAALRRARHRLPPGAHGRACPGCAAKRVRRAAPAASRWQPMTPTRIYFDPFKIGAVVTVSVRRIKILFATACPARTFFALAHPRVRSIGLDAGL